MANENQDFVMWEGEYKKLNPSPLTDRNDEVVDLTQSEIEWVAFDDGKREIEKTTSDGIDVISPSDGKYEIVIDSSDTDGLGGKYMEHEARVIDIDGHPSVVMTGQITIKTSEIN